MFAMCDEPFVELLGAELLEGGVVFHFECREGWDYTIVITDWSPFAKVILFHPYRDGVIGMTFNAELIIEPIEVAEQIAP